MKTVAKWLLVFGASLFLALGTMGCGGDNAAQPGNTNQRRQAETVKPNDRDGQIYQTVETFINALVKDDRNTVLGLLTSDHRNSWREDSFLLNSEAKEQFEEFAADNLNYTVVRYVNNEDTNFIETAFIIAAYDVVMKNGGVEASRVKIQESLAFRQENGQWRISVNERGFLVREEQRQ